MILGPDGKAVDVEPIRDHGPSAARDREWLRRLREFDRDLVLNPCHDANEFVRRYMDTFCILKVDA